MRLVACAVLMGALIACGGSGTGGGPDAGLSGTWVYRASVAGTQTTMNLTQSNDLVSGSGLAQIEAGQPRGFSAQGTFDGIHLSLEVAYDAGTSASYDATLTAPDQLDGTWSESGTSGARTFTRSAQ